MLECLAVVVINLSKESFNERDQQELNAAKGRCEKFYPDAPCVEKFTKVDELTYRVVCGPKQEKK